MEDGSSKEKPKKVKMPKCPYCGAEMEAVRYKGYYESFTYWDCNCSELPVDGEKEYRGYAT